MKWLLNVWHNPESEKYSTKSYQSLNNIKTGQPLVHNPGSHGIDEKSGKHRFWKTALVKFQYWDMTSRFQWQWCSLKPRNVVLFAMEEIGKFVLFGNCFLLTHLTICLSAEWLQCPVINWLSVTDSCIHRVKWRHTSVVAMRSPFYRSTRRTGCS